MAQQSLNEASGLKEAANAWRLAAGEAWGRGNTGLAEVCERTVQAIEHQIKTGVVLCICCFKPLGGQPTFGGRS